MSVEEKDGKWYTVSKAGKVGKRGFTSKENAEAAQARGRALLASSGGPAPTDAVKPSSDPDTSVERKALGIPPKPDEESW